jgi:hypothetical protein
VYVFKLSKCRCQNYSVKIKYLVYFRLEYPNKSQSKTVEYFKLNGIQETWFLEARKCGKKIGSGRKCGLSSFKVRAGLKKQAAGRSAKLYRELRQKKHLTKMRVHRKAKKSALKTTTRQYSIVHHQSNTQKKINTFCYEI